MTSKTALILGCTGQDGSLICLSLLKKGYKVIGLSRSKSDICKNHIDLGIEKDIEIRKGDIRHSQIIAQLLDEYQPGEIYNLAGQSSVGKSFIHPVKTSESIIGGTINILEVSRKLDYKGQIFFAGSSEMFGHTEQAADIDHPQKPHSPYAIGKQTSFAFVKMYREVYNLNCVTGVLFNHESHLRSDSFVTQKIIEGAILTSRNKNNKIHLGNLNVSRDWGWAPEYVEAMQIITQSNTLNDHVICTGQLTSLTDFLTIAYKAVGLNWEDHIETDNSLIRNSDIEKSFGNPNPLFKDHQWKAKKRIGEIIELLIEKKSRDL